MPNYEIFIILLAFTFYEYKNATLFFCLDCVSVTFEGEDSVISNCARTAENEVTLSMGVVG